MLIRDLNTGDMISFRIVPDTADGQINANRWGLFKVLHVSAPDMVAVAPYGDIYDAPPKLGWLSRHRPLIEQRFPHLKHARGGMPSVTTLLSSTTVDLPDAQLVKAKTKLSAFETETVALIKHGSHLGTYMAWATLSMQIDHEDRARRDHSAWRADIDRRTVENEAKWKAQREREAARLKGITLGQLADETPFAAWDQREKIVPPAYREAARDRMRTLIKALHGLGDKPRRPAVRQELRACVEWFNDVDGTMGYAIETEEREDIHAALEEICWACKQKPLIQEIENWRDW